MNGACSTAAGIPFVMRRAPEPTGKAVVYLHGGGLVYGSMRDYPECSAQMFLDRGYDLLSIGYPLVPETRLDDMIESTFRCVTELMEQGLVDDASYYAFGRSAGVFVWAALLDRLKREGMRPPRAFLAFYGYASLGRVRLFEPDPTYRGGCVIEDSVALDLIRREPVHDDPQMDRLLLYVFARQRGMLGMLLGIEPDAVARYDFEQGGEGALPPVFATWCARDDEVSPEASQALCALSADCAAFVVDAAGHDYDQQVDEEAYEELMGRLFAWLAER